MVTSHNFHPDHDVYIFGIEIRPEAVYGLRRSALELLHAATNGEKFGSLRVAPLAEQDAVREVAFISENAGDSSVITIGYDEHTSTVHLRHIVTSLTEYETETHVRGARLQGDTFMPYSDASLNDKKTHRRQLASMPDEQRPVPHTVEAWQQGLKMVMDSRGQEPVERPSLVQKWLRRIGLQKLMP